MTENSFSLITVLSPGNLPVNGSGTMKYNPAKTSLTTTLLLV